VELCADLADRFRHLEVEAVVGPAIGAIVPAYEVARALGARSLWTERVDGEMTLRRSFALRPGERVLVVEDVITTGGSVREVVQTVEAAGGRVVGIGALVDRSGAPADFGVPFAALLSHAAETFAPGDCPLCREGVPLMKPGSREAPSAGNV
jgi:orotate phosphoribosyltransferase